MSLLQDALRALQEEHRPTKVASLASSATPSLRRLPTSTKKRTSRLAMAGLVMLAAIAALAWLAKTQLKGLSSPATASSSAPEMISSASAGASPSEPTHGAAVVSARNVQLPSPNVELPPSMDIRLVKPAPAREPTIAQRTVRSRASTAPVAFTPQKRSRPISSVPLASLSTPATPWPTDRLRFSIPPEAMASFNQGSLALAAGDQIEAERVFRGLVVVHPHFIEAWNNLGIALLRQGNAKAARAAFERALALDPQYPAGLQNMGLLLLVQEGRPAEAIELFRQAVLAAPDTAAPRVNLAVALARSGRIAGAYRVLREAHTLFPRDPDLLYHLGTISERLGNRPVAAEAYAAFLKAARGMHADREQAVRERLEAWSRSSDSVRQVGQRDDNTVINGANRPGTPEMSDPDLDSPAPAASVPDLAKPPLLWEDSK